MKASARDCAIGVPAVVAGGSEVVLGVVRDLGCRRVPVVAMGPDESMPAFRSRYCTALRCADPHYDEKQFVADLEAEAATLPQRGVLFAADDDFARAISRNKTRLQRSYIVPVAAWEQMRVLADKMAQMEIAARAGIETPITAVIRGPDDLGAAAEAVPFPAVLKSVVPTALLRRADRKVVTIEDRERLAEIYARFSSARPFLLQEVIPGGDTELYIAGACHDAQSHCLALFTGRKLRQHPRGFGTARLCETRWEPEIAELTMRLLAEARYQGISDVEFKRDARDGRFKFMEINPRPGYLAALPRAAGVNLSYVAYRDAIGRPCPPSRQRDGVRWTDLLRDGPDSLREWWRGELRLGDWLRPLAGVRADAWLSVRDPRPALGEIRPLTRRARLVVAPGRSAGHRSGSRGRPATATCAVDASESRSRPAPCPGQTASASGRSHAASVCSVPS